MSENLNKLSTISQMMGEEHKKMEEGAQAVQRTSEQLKRTDGKYNEYDDGLTKAARDIKLIQEKERRDELLFQFSFYLFLVSAAYIFLKRFYFNEILYYVLFALEYTIRNIIYGMTACSAKLGVESDFEGYLSNNT